VVTAGHCVQSESDCSGNKWVFDYLKGDSYFKESAIYSCQEVIKTVLDGDTKNDYAVIRLDRKVKGRKFFKIRSTGSIQKGTSLVVIGHPSGLPTKIADGSTVRDASDKVYFVADLDTFGGNSGSAVLSVGEKLLEGILVRGDTDYKVVDHPEVGRCRVVNKCEQDACNGEEVTKITAVEGIPVADDADKLFTGFFQDKNYPQVQGVLNFKHYAYAFGDFQVMGRKFLDSCGAHFSKVETPTNAIMLRAGACSKSMVAPVFDQFTDQLYY
jgi:hypothetical protein